MGFSQNKLCADREEIQLTRSLWLFLALSLFINQGTGEQRIPPSQIATHPLPRYEEGKPRSYDPDSARRLPIAVFPFRIAGTPTDPAISTPPDYKRNSGILLRWSDWNTVVKRIILEAADKTNGSSVTLLVRGDRQQANADAALSRAGTDMDQVEFVQCKTNSIWIRDYGPHFIRQGRERAIVDSRYLAKRHLDDILPQKLSQILGWPLHALPLRHSGGNLLVTSEREGFLTDIIYMQNPEQSQNSIASLLWKYYGLDILHVFSAFPPDIDRTGHIDMWMSILSDHTVVIGRYDQIGPAYEAAVITEAAVTYMQNEGFIVYRTPGWNNGPEGYKGVHFTYTNCILLNDKVLVPQYGGSYGAKDAEALETYRTALPDHTIVGVNCAAIIEYAGALHCICRNIPQRLSARQH